jgi:hypothetical protein
MYGMIFFQIRLFIQQVLLMYNMNAANLNIQQQQ